MSNSERIRDEMTRERVEARAQDAIQRAYDGLPATLRIWLSVHKTHQSAFVRAMGEVYTTGAPDLGRQWDTLAENYKTLIGGRETRLGKEGGDR